MNAFTYSGLVFAAEGEGQQEPATKKQKLTRQHREDATVLHENSFLAEAAQFVSKVQRTSGVAMHDIPEEVDDALGKLREVEAWTAKKAAATPSGKHRSLRFYTLWTPRRFRKLRPASVLGSSSGQLIWRFRLKLIASLPCSDLQGRTDSCLIGARAVVHPPSK